MSLYVMNQEIYQIQICSSYISTDVTKHAAYDR